MRMTVKVMRSPLKALQASFLKLNGGRKSSRAPQTFLFKNMEAILERQGQGNWM
jgi:hypothetical protein